MLIAFVLSDLCVALCARIGLLLGANDEPGTLEYKLQKAPTPFLGGLGLFIGFFLALLTTLDYEKIGTAGFHEFLNSESSMNAVAILIGGGSTALLGLVDDFKPINASIKLLALAIIVGFLSQIGLTVDFAIWPPLAYAITLLWIVGVTSSFNAIDNTDGISGTTAASVAFFTFLVAWSTSAELAQEAVAFVAIALFGALIGFLRHNRPTARIYLGNCGSFSLGFVVAVLAIQSHWTSSSLYSAVAPILLVSYPLFDLGYTTLMRWRAGVVRSPLDAVIVSGRDHTAHRLKAMGLNTWMVIAVVAFLNMIGGIAALSITLLEPDLVWFWLIVTGVCVVYAGFGLVIRKAVDPALPSAHMSLRAKAINASKKSSSGRSTSQKLAPVSSKN